MSSDTDFSDLLTALDYNHLEDDFPEDLLPFIGFLIAKAAQSIVEAVDTGLAEFGINSRHYGIMLLLARQAGLPQSAIGQTLRIDRTTMVTLIDDLEKLALVERHRDPNDRRAYALSLSAEGQKILPDISQRVIQIEQTSLGSLEQGEIQQLFVILLKLLQSRS